MPVMRYEREAPGELLHMDTKKLGRIVRQSHRVTGNRRGSVEGTRWKLPMWPSVTLRGRASCRCTTTSAKALVDLLQAAVAHYAALSVPIKPLNTDNGSAHRSKLFV